MKLAAGAGESEVFWRCGLAATVANLNAQAAPLGKKGKK